METKLDIKKITLLNGIEINALGRIDSYGSITLENAIKEEIHSGHYNIYLNLEQVSYISSAGIRILIKYFKQIKSLNGILLITSISENVKSVITLIGAEEIISSIKKEQTEPSKILKERTVEEDNITYTIKDLNNDSGFKCRLIGKPALINSCGFSEKDLIKESVSENKYGLGLGAIGNNFAECKSRFGEFLIANGTAAYFPTDGTNSPDYAIAAGKYVPELQIAYGIICEGYFSKLFQFESVLNKPPVKLSQIANLLLKMNKEKKLCIVIAGEIAGLVGAALNVSPFEKEKGFNPFSYPDVKESVNYTTERDFSRTLGVIIGIVSDSAEYSLADFTKPLNKDGKIFGHFHAAVFQYKPIKKNVSDLTEIINPLFEDEQLETVKHLINDDREIMGIGETELIHGLCWAGKIV